DTTSQDDNRLDHTTGVARAVWSASCAEPPDQGTDARPTVEYCSPLVEASRTGATAVRALGRYGRATGCYGREIVTTVTVAKRSPSVVAPYPTQCSSEGSPLAGGTA